MIFKNISRGFWFQFVPSLTLSSIAIILLSMGIIPAYYLWTTLLMWVLVSGLGIAVGYHRIFSHKTHTLPTWKENLILFFAVFAGQGSSIFWVALHRGYHHPFADKERDIHSPVVYGKWQSFAGWFKDLNENTNFINIKYSVDLLKRPNHIWFHKYYFTIFWLVPILVAIIDWKLAFTMFWLTSGIAVLQDNFINVSGHQKFGIGYRNFDTDDNSHNNIVYGLLAWGQGWHNNHHHDPKSYDFGTAISGKWYEYDPCRIFLPFLNKDS